MKPKHQRLIFIICSMLFLLVSTVLVMRAFQQNMVFFYSPQDISQKNIPPTQLIRIGGLVEAGSVVKEADDVIEFKVTDNAQSVHVTYSGMLPTLFREGQGLVAEGYITSPMEFKATRVLTKHDENYMPKEVVDSLKKSGRWKEGQ